MILVQRLSIILVLFVGSFCTSSAYAETILADENFIPYVAGKESRNKVVAEKYKITLAESSRVKLHFISKVRNDVSFKLIETDTENIIGAFSKELSFEDSPFTQVVDLRAGKYTFIVYKEPSYGSVHNTGKYRFTFDKVEVSRILPEKAVVDGGGKIITSNDSFVIYKNTIEEIKTRVNDGDRFLSIMGTMLAIVLALQNRYYGAILVALGLAMFWIKIFV